MKKQMKTAGIGFYILILAIIFFAVYVSGALDNNSTSSYNINTFKSDLDSGRIESVEILPNQETPTGEVSVVLSGGTKISFYVSDVKEIENILNEDIEFANRYKVHDIQKTSWIITTLLPYGLGIIVIFFLFSFLSAQSAGANGSNAKMMNFGKSRAQRIDPNDQHAKTFRDVAGLKEEKEELEEIVDFLANPGKYTGVGARIPKGIILVGPPGTGKTLLAKAVAGEAGVPFFSLSGSDFVEMFVGVGASRVRDLFAEAKRSAPCIVFIDEIDAIGARRSSNSGAETENNQTLNQLLVEMDGFSSEETIIVLAATNRPEMLDKALLRPGRFDRQITIPTPDLKGRLEILKIHTRDKKISENINLENIAEDTAGFTGAELANILNEAAIIATKRMHEAIEDDDIEEAVKKVTVGLEKRARVISDKDKKLTAYHEAGHAVVSRYLPTQTNVKEVSIIPRGVTGGYTMYKSDEDKYYISKTEMEEKLIALLGGRAAEKLVLDDISTGASNDIEVATKIARGMVTKYGMSDTLGPIDFQGKEPYEMQMFGENIGDRIGNEVKLLIDTAYKDAQQLLIQHRDKLDAIALTLLEKEKINEEDFRRFFEDCQ